MRLFALALLGVSALAQNNPILPEDTVKVSEHVYAILGWPNIAIVVGEQAALVVDTGLGPRNGATIARVAARLAPNRKLYLTTTHFHPEHAAGEAGFPPGTILIRDSVQQQEMEQHGKEMVDLFSGRSPQFKELLSNATFRTPDVTFDKEYKLDLGGGVTARLLWFGRAHTKGDELTLVEPDRTLVSGDVVQDKVVPNIFREGGTSATWIAVLDKLATLNVQHVLPDHSKPGDGTLIAKEKAFITDLRNGALEMKKKGMSADDAGKQLAIDLKSKYSDWPNLNVAGFVRSIYAE